MSEFREFLSWWVWERVSALTSFFLVYGILSILSAFLIHPSAGLLALVLITSLLILSMKDSWSVFRHMKELEADKIINILKGTK